MFIVRYIYFLIKKMVLNSKLIKLTMEKTDNLGKMLNAVS